MEKNEEKNIEEKVNKKEVEHRNTKISIIVFVVGLIISLAIFGLGRFMIKYETQKANEITEQRKIEATKLSEEKVNAANEELKIIEKEYNEENEKLKKLKEEKRIIDKDFGKEGWFEKSTNKNSEIYEVETRINDLLFRNDELLNGNYTVIYDIEQPKNLNFYKSFDWVALGLMIVITLISIIYFLATRKK